MKSILLSALFAFGFSTYAQGPVISESTFFCKVDQFTSRSGKATAKQLRQCSKLVEPNETQVKNGMECKERAIKKGNLCLKINGAEQVSVTVKFTEKFGANANLNSFTCEVDKSGNSACP